MYILRSDDNAKAVAAEQQDFMVRYQAARGDGSKGVPVKLLPREGAWTDPRPGDCMVDRDLKTVYWIAPDGSRRRVDDPAAKQTAIDEVKRQLQQLKEYQEVQAKLAREKREEPRVILAK